MKTFIGSVALIRHPEELEQRWLLKKQSQSEQLSMVIAERLEGESYRDCLDRELAWSLRLRRGKDYLISSMARLHIEEQMQLPGECQPAWYHLEFYVVDLYGRTGKESIAQNSEVRWLSRKEVLAGAAETGEQVDEHLVQLINKYELISPYQT